MGGWLMWIPALSQWTDRVLAEFYAVGDRERSLCLDLSMFCDRTQPRVAKCQVASAGGPPLPHPTHACAS